MPVSRSGRSDAEHRPPTAKRARYITTLYKWGTPRIRFNVNNIGFSTDTCACGGSMRRLRCIYGRANVVKLRGMNVFPKP